MEILMPSACMKLMTMDHMENVLWSIIIAKHSLKRPKNILNKLRTPEFLSFWSPYPKLYLIL